MNQKRENRFANHKIINDGEITEAKERQLIKDIEDLCSVEDQDVLFVMNQV